MVNANIDELEPIPNYVFIGSPNGFGFFAGFVWKNALYFLVEIRSFESIWCYITL